MNKVSPLSALHALGLDLHEVTRETVYKGKKGVPFKTAKKWFNMPAKDAEPQIKAMFKAACRILRREGRLK